MASSAERRHPRHRSSLLTVLAALAALAAVPSGFVACGDSSEAGSDGAGSSDDSKGRFIPVEAAAQPPLPPGAGPAPPGPGAPPSDAGTTPTDAAPTDSAITDATGQ